MGDHFDLALAHVTQAVALLALDRTSEAIGCYELAIVREADYPQVRTGAELSLAFLIATETIDALHERALVLLELCEGDSTFPVDSFKWHAARALIASHSGHTTLAQVQADMALQEACRKRSGLRYHQKLGLVSDVQIVEPLALRDCG